MKKIMSVLLIAVLLLGLLPAQAAECPSSPSGKHVWNQTRVVDEPSCTSPGWGVHECVHCNRREDVRISPLGHDLGSWLVIEPPTCTEPGVRRRTCTRCRYFEEAAANPSHDYGPFALIQPPTCTEDGVEQAHCRNCFMYWNRAIPALGHEWGEWYPVKPATAIEEGLERRDCIRGDAYEERLLPRDTSNPVDNAALAFTRIGAPDPLAPEVGQARHINYRIENIGDVPLKIVYSDAKDDHTGGTWKDTLDGTVLEPHKTMQKTFAHVVHETDLPYMTVSRNRSVAGYRFDPATGETYGPPVISNTVWVEVPLKEPEEPRLTLKILTQPDSLPGVPGEMGVVTYTIINTGNVPILLGELWESCLNGTESYAMDLSDQLLLPNGSLTRYTYQTVCESDLPGLESRWSRMVSGIPYAWGDWQVTDETVLLSNTEETVIPLEHTDGYAYRPALTKAFVDMDGDDLTYLLRFVNTTGKTLYSVVVRDPYLPEAENVIGFIDRIEPGEYRDFTVTVGAGGSQGLGLVITNIAEYDGTDGDGNPVDGYSDPVTVVPGDDGNAALIVTKTETSAPGDGRSYYVEGETIAYTLTVQNVGDQPLLNIRVTDGDCGVEQLIECDLSLDPGDMATRYYQHQVTADDVARGYVFNVAIARYFTTDGTADQAFSPMVYSFTGDNWLIPPIEILEPFAKDGDSCRRTLLGMNDAAQEYELHICNRHQHAALDAGYYAEQGDYARAQQVWTDALCEMLDEVYAHTASPEGIMAALGEKALTLRMLRAREELLRAQGLSDAEVGGQMCTLLRDLTADLCQSIHTIGQAPADAWKDAVPEINEAAVKCARIVLDESLARVHYKLTLCPDAAGVTGKVREMVAGSAGKEIAWQKARGLWGMALDAIVREQVENAEPAAQQAIAADRAAFERWIENHAGFMQLFYAPDVAQEAAARQMLIRLTEVCTK